ncbi:hypothetical protein L6452_15235 [Arctium lappa]|uniref:Uncharacterized protein n=1 Tax=Arctium lappa TaxID=4217 RepID=A0ACB9CNE1_ARCLA|nr:hypothetical protein L6452_15235 [Arctium lappa]
MRHQKIFRAFSKRFVPLKTSSGSSSLLPLVLPFAVSAIHTLLLYFLSSLVDLSFLFLFENQKLSFLSSKLNIEFMDQLSE